jgi:alpha-glucosidase (family GH31 glycosyl hydrolase)
MIVEFRADELWWGGHVALGHEMPYDQQTDRTLPLEGNTEGNQSQPVFFSSKGRLLWSREPFTVAFHRGQIRTASRNVLIEEVGTTLRDAHAAFVRNHCAFNGTFPEPGLFTRPQFNTWIELTYDQREERILEYARGIVEAGFEPGVLMIDDNWQEDYGVWEFAASRFRNPAGMVRQLHDLGFTVLLWVCPFVSADSATARELARAGCLLREGSPGDKVRWSVTDHHPALVRWWNGASAVLDLGNPGAAAWFRTRLDRLRSEYGVDGFKFDAGDAEFYRGPVSSFQEGWGPNDHTQAFAELASEYPWSELRACWRLGGSPVAQRLRDKCHLWEDLDLLIPHMGLLGLLGHPFACPDLIGGGEYQSFIGRTHLDQELFVRWTQCSALMPMMQFSAAPWRVLDPASASLCLDAAALHTRHAPRILDLARHAANTGEPILRLLAWQYPHLEGAERVRDQFLLGEDLLVAPVLTSGARERPVLFPSGLWIGDRGERIEGPGTHQIEAPLDRLPHFALERD